jgi:peptidoglycan/xylan/chitin deacetylase (PgdA/CDA1 family)
VTPPDRPLILGYHAVSSAWRAQLAISEADLRTQLAYVKKRGYVGLTISDAERRRREGTLPHRSVVVTFDDGYASTSRAAPILGELGFPGTVFVVTDFVDSGEPLSWPGIDDWLAPDTVGELKSLTWDDVETLAAQGWEVGSHTVTHPVLTNADDERLQDELTQSRTAIEQRLGRCTSVAYPYGVADRRVADAAGRAGYEVGCTLTFAHFVDEPLRRPRIGMGHQGTRLGLAVQVSRFGRAARRSRAVRLARTLRRKRAWIPDG